MAIADLLLDTSDVDLFESRRGILNGQPPRSILNHRLLQTSFASVDSLPPPQFAIPNQSCIRTPILPTTTNPPIPPPFAQVAQAMRPNPREIPGSYASPPQEMNSRVTLTSLQSHHPPSSNVRDNRPNPPSLADASTNPHSISASVSAAWCHC